MIRKYFIFAVLFCLLLSTGCSWGEEEVQEGWEEERQLERKQECEESGGEWKSGSLMGGMYCVYTFSDGGEPCESSADCEGKCAYYHPESPPECQRSSKRGDCYTVVEYATEEEIARNRVAIMCRD